MHVLLDTNIVLDVFLNRHPWVTQATALWQAHDDGRVTGYLTATTLTTIFYVGRRSVGADRARQAVRLCLNTFVIWPMDHPALVQAEALPGSDFEDNLQIACAMLARLDAIVTRDPQGFRNTPIPALTPTEALTRLDSANKAVDDEPQAITAYEQALQVARAFEGAAGIARHPHNLEKAQRAIELYEQQIAIARELGNRRDEGQALGGLGNAYFNLGDEPQAIAFYGQALAIDQEIGNQEGVARNSWNLGLLYEQQGNLHRAAALMQVAADFYTAIGHAQYAEMMSARLARVRGKIADNR